MADTEQGKGDSPFSKASVGMRAGKAPLEAQDSWGPRPGWLTEMGEGSAGGLPSSGRSASCRTLPRHPSSLSLPWCPSPGVQDGDPSHRMQAPRREDQGCNVSRYVPHGQGLAQRGLLATSQVPCKAALKGSDARCPPHPQCQQSGPNGAEGPRSLRPTFRISSPVLSPNKQATLPGTPSPGIKLTCPQDRKSKAGRTWPEPLLFQAAAYGAAGWLQLERAALACSPSPAPHTAGHWRCWQRVGPTALGLAQSEPSRAVEKSLRSQW